MNLMSYTKICQLTTKLSYQSGMSKTNFTIVEHFFPCYFSVMSTNMVIIVIRLTFVYKIYYLVFYKINK